MAIKMKFWDIRPILDKKATYNLVIGARSNGKSYGLLKYGLEQYKKHKTRFVYIRRIGENIVKKRAELLFDPLPVEKIFGVGYTIKYASGKYMLYDDKDELVDTICYTIALSDVGKNKSVPFSNVKLIIYDEFIKMQNEKELFDEVAAFENTISTITRYHTDVQIFLLANTVSKHSPFFTYFGIDINSVKQGEIVVREYTYGDNEIGRIALEYCEYIDDIGKRSSKYALKSNMISKGEWELAPISQIPQVNNERYTDKMLFSMYISSADIYVGCFLRNSTWSDLEIKDYLYQEKVYHRQFLVLKFTQDKSHYYNLTDQKSLSYNDWNSLDIMLNDIKESTEIDVKDELLHGRVYAESPFVSDYFVNGWSKYKNMTLLDLL